jgi:hypothetical protein
MNLTARLESLSERLPATEHPQRPRQRREIGDERRHECGRGAVSLRPQYPPNQLALAEALARSGDLQAARETYQRARQEALAEPPGSDRDEWLREADRGLLR